MKQLRLLIIIMSALVAWSAAYADDVVPVRWRTIIKMSSPTEGTVTFRALVASGWHLYGLELPAGGPKATKFDLSGSTGVEFTDSVKPTRTPLSADDPMFGMTLTWWDSNIEFKVRFRLTGENNPTIKAAIAYMCCDGSSCRPPKTERISAPVPPYAQ